MGYPIRKIREAKAALEQEAREAAAAKQTAIEARELEGPRPGPKPQPLCAVPAPTAQRNFTDPESRIMPASGDKGSFVQAHNCQAAVDATAQIIIAADETRATPVRQTENHGEPVFGQIKQGRGFRQYLLRGYHQARGEWALICPTHNVLKLWRTTRRRPAP